jgi:hypothetical protein
MELAWVLSLRPEVRSARSNGGRCQRFDLHTQFGIMPSLTQDANFDTPLLLQLCTRYALTLTDLIL